MFSSLALAGIAGHVGGWGVGLGFFFFLIPLFWIGVVILIVSLARRRHGWGPGHYAGYRAFAAAGSAESTLAERFAQGDIEEVEYRARLEVLRANNPVPPQGR